MKFIRVENGVAVFTHSPRPRFNLFNGETEWYTETRRDSRNIKLRIRNLQKEAPGLDMSEERVALRALAGTRRNPPLYGNVAILQELLATEE